MWCTKGLKIEKRVGYYGNHINFLEDQVARNERNILEQRGIRLIRQKEYYSSRCPPTSPLVSKRYAKPSNRKQQGLYVQDTIIYDADSLGAFNILRFFYILLRSIILLHQSIYQTRLKYLCNRH